MVILYSTDDIEFGVFRENGSWVKTRVIMQGVKPSHCLHIDENTGHRLSELHYDN
jgi:hypothetical protein